MGGRGLNIMQISNERDRAMERLRAREMDIEIERAKEKENSRAIER